MALNITEFVDQIGKMTVLEVADLVKAIEDKFGVSAAASVVSAAPAAEAQGASAAAEKTEFKVTLKDAGAEKIKVIKVLRKVVPALSLSDAKKATEEVPYVIVEAASKADAEAMKKELEEAGAKVELS
jgi:large subunit ribosomal protein L7/L12